MPKASQIGDRPTPVTLGTAQLGLDYGVANKSGCPDGKKAVEILKTAFDNGIRSFDTAWNYGKSESVIGDFIASEKKEPFIISKLPDMSKAGGSDFDPVYKAVRQHVEESLKRLKVKKIQAYLLHSAKDMDSRGGNVIKSLSNLKGEGMIGVIGVSVYYPEEAKRALSIDEIGAVQIPANIFDQRFEESGVLAQMGSSGKTVFARSAFMQGIFFLKPGRLPVGLEFTKEYLKKLHAFSESEGMTIQELAVCFLKSMPEISSIVIGAESKEQVLENIAVFNRTAPDKKLKERLSKAFSDIPLKVKLPLLWPNKPKGR